jgi:hypothetical protein
MRHKRTYGTPLKAQRGIFLGVFGFVQIAKIPVVLKVLGFS